MHSGLILFTLVVTMAASVLSSPVERFNCDSIRMVGERLQNDCKQAREAGLSAMFERLLEDQTITGDEFLGELNATCGDPAVRSRLVRRMFDCIANRISEKMLTEDRVPDCGAKWPDVFLSYWLHMIGMGHLSTTGTHEINTIMAMKEAQKIDASEMLMIDF